MADAALPDRFARAMGAMFDGRLPSRLGVAVSGGGDSVALMLLLADWARGRDIALHVATVDHGLREAAAQEAAFVAGLAASYGLPCQILTWAHQGDVAGNLQGAARDARYGLLADWARDAGIDAVALGHTQDDQAETFLMRLARGSGVDGLSGMAPVRQALGVRWLRPMLDISRAGLRDWLTARGVDWVDDPSNDDTQFARVRARQALMALGPLGLDAAGLARTASRMRRARDALSAAAFDAAGQVMRLDRGDVLLDHAGLLALPADLRDRLLAHALCVVGNTPYRPRLTALHRLCARLDAGLDGGLDGGQGDTLHGARLLLCGAQVRITREWQAVRDMVAAPGERWDGRWQIVPPDAQPYVVRALGADGLTLCPDWRATGLPRATLLASPSAWHDRRLIAAPLAGLRTDWRIFTAETEADVRARLLSH